MNEQQVKKRNWIKNAVIVFLTVMLVLTFFSNTIMNYSLPEVAVQYVESGSITSKIRGTGTIESSDPYKVIINESRVISSVPVKVGQEVEIGDVLFLLEDQESTELEEAEKTLDGLILAFEKKILSGEISQSAINNAQSGNISSVESYQKKMNAIKSEISKKQAVYDDLEKQIVALTSQISISGSGTVDTTNEEKELKTAKTNLVNAETAYQPIVTQKESLIVILKSNGYDPTLETETLDVIKDKVKEAKADEQDKLRELNEKIDVSGGDASSFSKEQAAYDSAVAFRKALEDYISTSLAEETAKAKIDQYQREVELAQKKLDNKKASADTSAVIANLERQKAIAKANQDIVANELKKEQDKLTNLVKDIQDELDLGAESDAIKAQKELVEKLRKKSVGSSITAPVAGTITAVNYVAGETTTNGDEAITIQPAGKGYTISFGVTNEQAKKLQVGTKAELVNAWYYEEMDVTLTGIKPDPQNPGKGKLLTFSIVGDVVAGQSLTVAVGENSANYDLIVPNSAIREDNNGKFVLLLEAKNSPLGTRYVATRVDVEVLAKDDTKSAIKGALYGWGDAIITTSTKPVTAGQLVRLAD